MKNEYIKKSYIAVGMGLIGLLAFILLKSHFLPYRAMNLETGKYEAIKIAASFLKERGYNLSGCRKTALLLYNDDAFLYLQKHVGWKKTQEIFRNSQHRGLNFYWNVFWFKGLPKNVPYEQFTVLISSTGKIIGFSHDIPAAMKWPKNRNANLTQSQALQVAYRFLDRHHISIAGFIKDSFKTEKNPGLTVHHFSWIKNMEKEGGKVNLKLMVQGDEVGIFKTSFGFSESKATAINRSKIRETLFVFVSYVFSFLFSLGVAFIFLKKYHEGEVGVKTAVFVFLLAWISLTVESGLNFRFNAAGAQIGGMSFDAVGGVLFSVLSFIVWPFFSILAFASWSVGEAQGRERFNRKFTALDSIFNGKFSTLNTAVSALNGYCSGFVGLGIIAVMTALIVRVFGGQIGEVNTKVESSIIPFPVPLLAAISSSIISEMTFRLFSNLSLYKYIKNKWYSIFISSLAWTIYAIGFWDIGISFYPMVWGWFVLYVMGVYLGYIFWKYDVLTTIFAHFTIVGIIKVLPMLTAGSESLSNQGVIALILLFLPLVFIIRGFLKKETFNFEAELVPGHIKRIAERVRMAKELEIARRVQLQLLPKNPPEIKGFEIDGICIPTHEVGGDYYDFIPVSPTKLAIVIGDVSGKGVPAAIYMTLTKGIIHSQVENQCSPEQILTRVNRSLYSMMDHKSFVTLFFGFIDSENRSLEISRAGHNPMYYFRHIDNQILAIKPEGIALGLENGTLFDAMIKKERIMLEPGDLVVFYTDGFSEAMNKDLEMFGEKRLMEAIYKCKERPIRDIINDVLNSVRDFTHGYPQHDDMTMVIIKVF